MLRGLSVWPHGQRWGESKTQTQSDDHFRLWTCGRRNCVAPLPPFSFPEKDKNKFSQMWKPSKKLQWRGEATVDTQVCSPGKAFLRGFFVNGHLTAYLTTQTTQNTLRKCSQTSGVYHAVRRREFLDAHKMDSMRERLLCPGVKFPAWVSGSSSQ